ncbi:MAG: ABC transporter permease [Streptosporangiaceae bacterium]|nr:ABC transporter permease [Streptosporangiaceae bacterium]
MSAVWTIALLTVREAVRRRLVAAFALISVVLVTLSGWGFYRLSHNVGFTSGESHVAMPEAVILFMFMFSFVVALSASAIASPAISSEIDSGVLQTVAARPVRRGEVLFGKWLGLAGLLAAYTAIVSGLQVAVVYWASGYVAPDPAAAAAFVFAEGVALLTLVLLLSTRLSALAAGVIGVALFGVAWLGGVVGLLGETFNVHALRTAGHVSQYLLPTDGLWHAAVYYLEPSWFITQQLAETPGVRGNPFMSLSAPSWPYLTWAAIWLVLVLVLGLTSFERREL